MPDKNFEIVEQTCLLIVAHYRNLLRHGKGRLGLNSRIFSHLLHPESQFVHAGTSSTVTINTPTHPEHVVPCAVLVNECWRLLQQGQHSNEQIATLLKKHWKLATITKQEQHHLDYELGYKSTMPPGWNFETGETFARLKLAHIMLVP